MEQLLDMSDGLGFEEGIAANRAYFGRNMVDYNDMAAMANRVHDLPFLVLSGAPLDAAVHCCLLWEGVIHFGGFGS
jgi:hypothetical protein